MNRYYDVDHFNGIFVWRVKLCLIKRYVLNRKIHSIQWVFPCVSSIRVKKAVRGDSNHGEG